MSFIQSSNDDFRRTHNDSTSSSYEVSNKTTPVNRTPGISDYFFNNVF